MTAMRSRDGLRSGRTLCLASLLSVLLMAPSRAAAFPEYNLIDFKMMTDPQRPVSHLPTALLLSAISPDLCLPQVTGSSIEDGTVEVTLYRSALGRCAQALGFWSERVELGYVEPGIYPVTLLLQSFPPPLPPSWRVLETGEFEVADPVAIAGYGTKSRKTVCVNRETGQRVVLESASGPSDCEAAGLTVQSGDKVRLHYFGKVDPDTNEIAHPVAVAAYGTNARKAVCVNRTTGQRVVRRKTAGPWDCEAAGLVVQDGDSVAVHVFGKVP